MIVVRLLIVIVALLLVICTGMYLFTRDNRYLRLAWQVMRFSVFLLLVIALIYLLERFVLTGWRILL